MEWESVEKKYYEELLGLLGEMIKALDAHPENEEEYNVAYHLIAKAVHRANAPLNLSDYSV